MSDELICFYCKKNNSSEMKFGKPSCYGCAHQKFSVVPDCRERTEEQLALLWSLLIAMDELSEEQRN